MKQERIDKGLWWDRAWSLVGGCTPVSAACLHCWSAAEAHMRAHQKNTKIRGQYKGLTTLKNGIPTFNGTVRTREDHLDLPLRTRKPTTWAVWSDLFHEDVPFEFSLRAMDRMVRASHHTFLILTKRPYRLLEFLLHWGLIPDPITGFTGSGEYVPENIWFGTTVEDQRTADERIPHLLRVPGNRFLSMEPLLGPVDLGKIAIGQNPYGVNREIGPAIAQIDAVIVGGESGPGSRPVHPEWVRSIRDQCSAAGVPFFVKQLYINGKLSKDMEEWPEDLKIRSLPWIR